MKEKLRFKLFPIKVLIEAENILSVLTSRVRTKESKGWKHHQLLNAEPFFCLFQQSRTKHWMEKTTWCEWMLASSSLFSVTSQAALLCNLLTTDLHTQGAICYMQLIIQGIQELFNHLPWFLFCAADGDRLWIHCSTNLHNAAAGAATATPWKAETNQRDVRLAQEGQPAPGCPENDSALFLFLCGLFISS